MRKILLLILLLQSVIVLSQNKNKFDIAVGANYPINLSEVDLAREFGFILTYY